MHSEMASLEISPMKNEATCFEKEELVRPTEAHALQSEGRKTTQPQIKPNKGPPQIVKKDCTPSACAAIKQKIVC